MTKSARKIKSIVSDVDEQAWQYPHSVDEIQGDSSGTDTDIQPGVDIVPSSMSIVSPPQKLDVHSTKEQVTVITGCRNSSLPIQLMPRVMQNCSLAHERVKRNQTIKATKK